MEIVINGRFLAQRATGVQRVAQEITRALDRMIGAGAADGVAARLVAPEGTDPAPLALRHIAFQVAPGARGNLWEQVTLPRHVGSATLLCLGNSAPVLSLLGRQPVAVMLHDQAYRLFPADYSAGYRISHGLIEHLLLRRATTVLSVSDAERTTILRTNPGVKRDIVVAANGSWIDDAAVSPPRRTPPADGYGLCVGSFTQRKNMDGIVATAIALARARGRRFRFVGPPGAMTTRIAAAIPPDLRHLIEFPGYVDDDALEALYQGADYLLYPSFYEASGLPPSEAMTFGCPVIVSDLPVMRERCGDAALYCDPHDHAAIERAALSLVDDPALSLEMSRRGQARAARFTWEGQARTILRAMQAAA